MVRIGQVADQGQLGDAARRNQIRLGRHAVGELECHDPAEFRSQMRRLTLHHALLAYQFGAVILALAMNVVVSVLR